MEGKLNEEERGIIPRTIDFIFDEINDMEKNGWTFKVEVACSEIYLDE
jgi:hypothetical protein